MQLSLFSNPAIPLIRDRLIAIHGRIDDERHRRPTDQFIRSFISSRTRDAISEAAFEKLRAHFPNWETLLTAKAEDVADLITEVQDAHVKAERLIQALNKIRMQRGTLDLGFLVDWPDTTAWSWLQTLPGVGPKVAAATLNFSSLRKPILTVDRHLLRMGKRLGLLPLKGGFLCGHRLLNELVPNDWSDRDHYQQHWLMKFHGQIICHHGTPRCGACPLTDICRHFAVNHTLVQ